MKKEVKHLYNNMLKDFEQVNELERGEYQKNESSFWIANDYWGKLKLIVKERGFKDEDDEMDFFRNVKPRFTSYIEYIMLVSQALRVVPVEEKNQISFWKEEGNRLKKFYNDNISFVIYYNRKSHYDDSIFFLRKNNATQNIRPISAHDSDAEYFTSHDHLISAYLAYNMYAKYARKKLWALTGHYR